jgi:putative phosphoesterase
MDETVAVITDIHANLPALEAALQRTQELGIERVYCGGDLVGYGPHPNQVCAAIRERCIPTIYGNYDYAIARDLEDCGCAYITPHLVHGSPRKVNEYLFEDKPAKLYERLAGNEEARVLAFGHTHRPWVHDYAGVLFVNCGSVGKPKDGDPRGAFALLRPSAAGVEVTIERVEYDADQVADEVRRAGLPVEFANKLVLAA